MVARNAKMYKTGDVYPINIITQAGGYNVQAPEEQCTVPLRY
jgi:hypothetical protein